MQEEKRRQRLYDDIIRALDEIKETGSLRDFESARITLSDRISSYCNSHRYRIMR